MPRLTADRIQALWSSPTPSIPKLLDHEEISLLTLAALYGLLITGPLDAIWNRDCLL